MIIKHFKHHEIDKKKYDECISQSSQGTIYATSWYLDTVAPGWELLATEKLDIVMPIPVKKKFGMTYSTQPPLCQQLGIFSFTPLEKNTLKSFLEHIPYSYYRLQLNTGNISGDSSMLLRQNYVLELSQSYEMIREKYKSNCLRNIKKAEIEQLQFFQSTEIEQYIETLLHNATNRPIINLIPLLKRLIASAEKFAKIEIWNAQNQSGEILSCILFIYWKNRIYYMVPVSTSEGKKQQSMSFLIDQLIQKQASSELILDFEGSYIPGIARFYEGFGAVCEHYPIINRHNFLTKIYFGIRNKNLPGSSI